MGEPQLDGGSEMRTERRKHPRKKPEVLVYLDLGPSNGGMVRDVSEGGIGFRAVSPMCAGQRSAFAFAFDGATRLEGECDLVWIDEGGRVGGLRFTEVSAELREAVRKHVAGASNRGEQLVEVPVTAATPIATLEEIRREIRQPSGATRRATRMPAQAPPTERVEPARTEQAIRAAPLLSQVADVSEEIEPETIPEIDSENKPEIGPELPAVARPVEPLLRAAAAHLSYEAQESRDQEMTGATRLDAVTLGRAITFMLMVTLLAGGYVYHRALGESLIWLGQQIAGDASPPQIAAPPYSAQSAAEKKPGETRTPTGTKHEPEPARVVETPKPLAPAPVPTLPAASTASEQEAPAPAPAAQAPKNEGNGQTEFLQALQILRGKDRIGELPEAVRLLWVAVEKGNSGAEVALADLYRRGEGMPQNCDQTRILLNAAVKKGNNEARNRLAQLESEGCP